MFFIKIDSPNEYTVIYLYMKRRGIKSNVVVKKSILVLHSIEDAKTVARKYKKDIYELMKAKNG